jgi:phenylacetate-CoA ligase
MGFLDKLKDRLIRRQYASISRHLRTASPEDLAAQGERRVLKAFHRAAKTVPAYAMILRQHGLDPDRVRTVEDFKSKVPIVDKETIFAANELRDLCAGGTLDDVALFYSSSGHSGVFSFGVETRGQARQTALGLEFALQDVFHVMDRRTLLVNCMSMGVKVHTRTIPLAETSVRPDVIWALVKKLRNDFEQFLFAGEQLFLKKVFEEGAEQGVPWREIVVHAITGAEYVAENYRSYLASLLGIDFDRPERGVIGVNFGLSELSLSILSENLQTLRLRRLACGDPEFRRALYGRETTICPNIMQYYPHQTYLETVPGPDGESQLVVSMLDPSLRIPLIRYNTRDCVELVNYGTLAEVVRAAGHAHLLPPRRLPFGVVWGKRQHLTTEEGHSIGAEHVKEAIYADFGIAASLTGNFRLQRVGDQIALLLQMRNGIPPTEKVCQTVAARLREFTHVAPAVQAIAYGQFPYGLDHDFERKCRYV